MYNEFIPKLYFEKILSDYLNPLFKLNGFIKERGNNWSKVNGEIFIRIEMQKSRSRIGKEVSFRFYLKMCPMEINQTNEIEMAFEKRSYCVEFEDVLPKERKLFKFKNHGWLGWYVIFRENACGQLLNEELKIDFENYIIPVVNKLNSNEIYSNIKNRMETYPKADIHLGIYDFI